MCGLRSGGNPYTREDRSGIHAVIALETRKDGGITNLRTS
jgi:hypothetical protein